ncbi:carboxy terminal-processing peptidase [Spongorhabdus nitratireducens]
MLFNPTFRKSQLTRSLAVVLATFSLSSLPVHAKTDATTDPLPELKPNLNQAIASANIYKMLELKHYERLAVDEAYAERFFNQYLEQLDRYKRFFLAADVEEFDPWRKKLAGTLKNGDLRQAYEIFNRRQQRAEERLEYLLKLLDNGISILDFTRDEALELERDKAPWLDNKNKQFDLWRREFKESVLSMRMNKRTEEEISNQLRKRFTNQLRYLKQTRSEDAFQTYINSFVKLFDPHTEYFSPQSAENFDISMSLSLEGIGAVLQADDEYTKVVSLVPAGPADKAGQLKPGDKIIGVGQGKDGPIEEVIGMRLDEVVKKIRGPKSTLVRLEVITSGGSESNTSIYPINRDKVKLEEQSAQKYVLEIPGAVQTFKIGVISIPTFYIDFKAAQAGDPEYKSTTRDVRQLISELKKERVDGLVIDLRNNGGGSLQEANQLTGLFIDSGPTVVVKDGRGRMDIQRDTDPGLAWDGPMTVLINRLSASASEIFAGAMQDYGRALIIGSQSFGKGTVQTIQPLNHGQLKYTLAKFYRISGMSTQNRGIIPDIAFPSLYNPAKIGESSLPNALPWDTIEPIDFESAGTLAPYFDLLEKRHSQRVSDNADFMYLNDMKNFLQQADDIETLSLNEKARKAQEEAQTEQKLAIENRLRKAKGEKELKSLEELADEATSSRFKGPTEEEVRKDAMLVESGHILVDYIQLNRQYTADLSKEKDLEP